MKIKKLNFVANTTSCSPPKNTKCIKFKRWKMLVGFVDYCSFMSIHDCQIEDFKMTLFGRGLTTTSEIHFQDGIIFLQMTDISKWHKNHGKSFKSIFFKKAGIIKLNTKTTENIIISQFCFTVDLFWCATLLADNEHIVSQLVGNSSKIPLISVIIKLWWVVIRERCAHHFGKKLNTKDTTV